MAQNPLNQLYIRRKQIEKELKSLEKSMKSLNKELTDINKALEPIEKLAEQYKNLHSSANKEDLKPIIRAKPAQVVVAAKNILEDNGAPMTRGELLDALNQKGIIIAGDNPANTLGTTLSRKDDIFTNIRGFGYWLKDKSYPPAGYHTLPGL